jgi:hypothetical protein
MKMKKLILSSFIVFSFFSPVLAKDFSDVNTVHPNFVAIGQLSDEGVLNGYEDGTFRPEQIVNRAEAVKMILGVLQIAPQSNVSGDVFIDVKADDWFAGYVAEAKSKGLINGNADGTFAPARSVKRAELMKILLSGVGFKKDTWEQEQLYPDVPLNQWYTPYMNYAGKSGIISKDKEDNLYPAREMTRGEVAESLYLLQIILRGEDTGFLVDQAEKQWGQIEPYLEANDVENAHRASDLAVNITQQAIKIAPADQLILAKAKIARSYQLLVDSLIAVLEGNKTEAIELSKQAITKAEEAKQLSIDVTELSTHLVQQANEVIRQAAI